MKKIEKKFYDFVFSRSKKTKIINVDENGCGTYRKCAVGKFIENVYGIPYSWNMFRSTRYTNKIQKLFNANPELKNLLNNKYAPKSYGILQKWIFDHTDYVPENPHSNAYGI